MKKHQVFISYSGRDTFEASLLQYAIESMLSEEGVTAWTFQRDQAEAIRKLVKGRRK